MIEQRAKEKEPIDFENEEINDDVFQLNDEL
jgi:hypothetical protein